MENYRQPDEEALRNYHDLKARLDSALKKANATKDLKEAKGYLIEVQGRFKGLKLQREQREELYGRLQAAFDRVNEALEEERHSFENDAQLNYFALKPKVEEASYRAEHPGDLKETWDFLVGVQAEFKGVRLLREHREELYARLQAAFEKIKLLRESERTVYEKQAAENYPELKKRVEDAVDFATQNEDLRAVRERLIAVQLLLREMALTREQRDEAYNHLQEGFTILKIRQEQQETDFESQSDDHYSRLLPRIREAALQAETVTEFRPVRESLKMIQAEMKELSLKREHRDELFRMIQDAFDLLSLRQDEANAVFDREAAGHYDRLKGLVDQGLQQAEETHQYKETREFLKMIQSEFRGIKLKHEQREELYSRLQTAFDILGKRLDEFFRQKKKNWAVKMEYKVSAFDAELFALEEQVKKEKMSVAELEDQLEIMQNGRKEQEAAETLVARIEAAKRSIGQWEGRIRQIMTERDQLKNKLEPDDFG